jgi:peptidoglycan/LPS O-acetylase OafA/YrhL
MYIESHAREFRNDINGLRAWAVLAVVLYHFNVPGFQGGFIGVDIFFVISGFLMAGIVIPKVSLNRFSIVDFYFRRVLKIVPPLIFVVIFFLFYGWFFLSSVEYNFVGKQALSAVLFVSNILFSHEVGYFEAPAHEKWLLHTWSLSVEWQFYLIFPVVIMAASKLGGQRFLVSILITLFALSLFSSFFYAESDPQYAFYLLPARAWELLAGVGIWLFMQRRVLSKKSAIFFELLGFSLIVLSVSIFNSSYAWPSIYALLPIAGALFVIVANRNDSWLTNNYVFKKLGEGSYSIYLVHWPIMILFTLHSEYENAYVTTVAVLLSLAVGFGLYYVLEKNIRVLGRELSKCSMNFMIGAPVIAIVLFTIFCIYTNGIDQRFRTFSDKINYVEEYSREKYLTDELYHEYRSECNFFDDIKNFVAKSAINNECYDVKGKPKTLMLWGDSHAQALSFGIRNHLRDDTGFIQIASSGCAPHIGVAPGLSGEFSLACERSNHMAWDVIEKSTPDVVVMAQRWMHEQNDYVGIVAKLKHFGVKKIIIIGPFPQWKIALPNIISLRHFDENEISFNDKAIDLEIINTNRLMRDFNYDDSNVTYVSIIDSLCKNDKCLTKVDGKNTPLSWDYGHLTLEGSDYVVSKVIIFSGGLKDYLK